MTIEIDVSGNNDPGIVEIKLMDSVEVLSNFNTCPAFTCTTTVPPVLSVSSAGNSVYPEKQLPGTKTSSKKNERDQAGTGSGKGGVSKPSAVQERR